MMLREWMIEPWSDYEYRWEALPRMQHVRDRFEDKPEWTPDRPPETVLVYNEQGHGDAFMNVRYLPILKVYGNKVVLEVVSSMVDLLRNCEGVDECITTRSKVEYDSHLSINSLPGIYYTLLNRYK